MNRIFRVSISMAFVLAAGSLSPCSAGDSPAAGVRCRCVDAQTLQPVAHVEVTLTGADGQDIETRSDGDGIASLPVERPGSYVATAMHEDYVPIRSGGEYPFEGAARLNLGASGAASDCVLRLKPLGRIEGRIVDVHGAPIGGVHVTLLRRSFARDLPAYIYLAETLSAADGSYFAPHLLPGVYLVRAEPPAASPGAERALSGAYHPAARDASTAMPLRLSSGREIGHVDIVLEEMETVPLALRVSSPTRRLVDEEVEVQVSIDDAATPRQAPRLSVKQRLHDGRITLPRIVPGRYKVSMTVDVEGQEERGSVDAVVAEGNAPMVDVSVAPPRDVVAKLVWDGQAEGAGKDRPTMMALLAPIADNFSKPPFAMTDGSGLLRFAAMRAGRYHWGVARLSETQFAELRVDGHATPGDLLNLPEGPPAALEFHIVEGAATLSVDAEPGDGACSDATLVVYAEEPRQSPVAVKARRFSCHFEATGLRPGAYRYALERNMESGEEQDPAFRARLTTLKKIDLEKGQRAQAQAAVEKVSHDY